VNLLTVAGAIMEIARDVLAGMQRPNDAAEAVKIAGRIERMVLRLRGKD
jgi:hypothetical protein